MTIVVCPAASLPALCDRHAPSHLLVLYSPGREPAALPCGPERLASAFNDIAEARPGLVAPDLAAMEAILAFGKTWTGNAPLVVSCELGISRSPAAAFMLACQARPEEPERSIAERLRRAAPCATPNPLMVELADAALGRAGRMVEAIRAIGRGAEYAPYEGFELRSSDCSVDRDPKLSENVWPASAGHTVTRREDRLKAYLLIAAISTSLIPCTALAQQVLKNEPPSGGMRSGEVIFVDNGKCPKGQIQKVTAGFMTGGGATAQGAPGGGRTRECVARQGM